MSLATYLELKRLYPDADANTMLQLQRDIFMKEFREKQQAEAEGREAAKAFAAAFEKELEKLFK